MGNGVYQFRIVPSMSEGGQLPFTPNGFARDGFALNGVISKSRAIPNEGSITLLLL